MTTGAEVPSMIPRRKPHSQDIRAPSTDGGNGSVPMPRGARVRASGKSHDGGGRSAFNVFSCCPGAGGPFPILGGRQIRRISARSDARGRRGARGGRAAGTYGGNAVTKPDQRPGKVNPCRANPRT